uniref:Protein Wnt n=1 Tax=Phallusia mammillata TaxID=59560 RepID=A0A6F9DXM7_9ASCI|nr:Wnt-5 [Phallusia mammillata]
MFSNSRVSFQFVTILIYITVVCVSQVNSHWWSLATKTLLVGSSSVEQCDNELGFSHSQRQLCRTYANHMKYVKDGAENGIKECKYQFRLNRWNCSTAVNDITVFGKVLKIGSKETAFTYAVAAAGVVVSVAQACKNGLLQECGCSRAPRPQGISSSWNWGGCGDDTDYAYGFAKEFIDARERDTNPSNKSKHKARKEMNLRNNEAGRLVAVRSSEPTCKCHGVSGSCNVRTCWMKLSGFREIGNKLKSKYNSAIEVVAKKRGRRQLDFTPRKRSDVITPTSLVYLESSPDYCVKNRRTGVKGTKGRECNVDSNGPDGCGLMCCGRGYRVVHKQIVEKCNCRFQWCCTVICDQCPSNVKRYVCK